MNYTRETCLTPSVGSADVPWNPWAALRRREHIELEVAPLPDRLGGGAYLPQGDWAAVLVDSRLNREERNVVLAHELVHDERGGGIPSCPGNPPGWQAVINRAEQSVDDEVARRLVPADELLEYCGPRAVFEAIWPHEVAEVFGVTEAVARRAMEQLR